MAKIIARLYVDKELVQGAEIMLDGPQGHYLVNVMRIKPLDQVSLFNGRAGEWTAEIIACRKGRARLMIREKTKEQLAEPDLWYLFAPIRKGRLDYMIEKATELGVSLIRPVLTEHTNQTRLKEDKLQINAIEAAEQCGRMTVPAVASMVRLESLLADWPEDRLLMFCDEAGEGDQNAFPIPKAIDEVNAWQQRPDKWAILIGPEGGFSERERRLVRTQPHVVPVTLGPRILRADTAAITAIALWQSFAGDWANG